MNVRSTTLGNGTQIAFLERPGGDRPLLLLHGITDDARTYEPLLERIDPACHVYARIERRLNSIGRMKPQALEDALAGSLEWDTDEVLARIQAPVVMITGNPALGAVVTAAESDRVAELVRGARVIHIDNVGHLVHDQQPDAWLAAVNDWAAA